MAAPRIYFAQARDGLFFRRFATIHPRFQTPHLSILMFGAWSALLAITGTYETLAAYAMFAAWVFYGLTVDRCDRAAAHTTPARRVRTA